MKDIKSNQLIITTYILLVVMSSCGTIISGTKSKINLNIPDSISVYEDGILLNPKSKSIKLKSNQQHSIVMKREGYKDAAYELYPRFNKYSLCNISASLGAIPFIISSKNSISGEQAKANVISAISIVVFPSAAFLVDIITGSYKVLYPSNLLWRGVKMPEIIERKNQLPIGCSNVNVKIKIGEKIGTNTIYGKKYSEIFWENTVNIKAEELEVIANNSLQDLGFKVPKELSDNGYKIDAEITGIDVTSDQVSNNNIITECRLNTKWTITNLTTNEVVKSEKIESFNLEKSKGISNSLLSSFENSLLIFLSKNKEIYDNTKIIENQPITPSSIEPILIRKPAPSNKLDLKSFVSSVVTVDDGNSGHGSGFFVSEDGLLVTNFHVVKNNKKVNIILSNGLSFIGDVVRVDAVNDVALIKISGKGFSPVVLSENEIDYQVGDEVYAIGTPADKKLSSTVTKGIISGNRIIENKTYIQTDVSVSPGNSGGPLINKKGQVIGMVTLKIINKGVEGLSFALPSSTIFTNLNLKYQ